VGPRQTAGKEDRENFDRSPQAGDSGISFSYFEGPKRSWERTPWQENRKGQPLKKNRQEEKGKG